MDYINGISVSFTGYETGLSRDAFIHVALSGDTQRLVALEARANGKVIASYELNSFKFNWTPTVTGDYQISVRTLEATVVSDPVTLTVVSSGTTETWSTFRELYRDWYVVSDWAPPSNTVYENQTLVQTRTLNREWKNGERSNLGNERNVYIETESKTETRTVAGSKPLPVTGVGYSSYAWHIIKRRSSTNSIQVSEFELRKYATGNFEGYPAGTIVSNPSGTWPVGEEPSRATDKQLGTKWLDFNFEKNGNKSILQIDLPSPISYNTYRWATANDWDARDPISWKLYGSTDKNNWILLSEVNDYQTPIGRFTFTNFFTF